MYNCSPQELPSVSRQMLGFDSISPFTCQFYTVFLKGCVKFFPTYIFGGTSKWKLNIRQIVLHTQIHDHYASTLTNLSWKEVKIATYPVQWQSSSSLHPPASTTSAMWSKRDPWHSCPPPACQPPCMVIGLRLWHSCCCTHLVYALENHWGFKIIWFCLHFMLQELHHLYQPHNIEPCAKQCL